MATYNGARYLREQIDSILKELKVGDELIVSDDGSTDETFTILSSYGSRIKIVGDGRAGGVVANFSRALSYAKGDFILLADQDDVWLEGRVALICTMLADYDLVMTNAVVVDETLNPFGQTLFDQIKPRFGFWANVLGRNSFVGCAMGFRSSLLKKVLPIPKVSPWHDWLLGLMATLGGRIIFVSTPTLLYRRHGSNASITGGVSTNSLFRKINIRMQVLLAVLVCYLRMWFFK